MAGVATMPCMAADGPPACGVVVAVPTTAPLTFGLDGLPGLRVIALGRADVAGVGADAEEIGCRRRLGGAGLGEGRAVASRATTANGMIFVDLSGSFSDSERRLACPVEPVSFIQT